MEINRSSDPVFFIISEKCLSSSQSRARPVSSCAQTLSNTRYERQISPFMPHWAGTRSRITKTNRGGGTLPTAVEKRGEKRERRNRTLSPEVLQCSWVSPVVLWQLHTMGLSRALFKCVSSHLPWVPGKKDGLHNCLTDPGRGTSFWGQSTSGA